MSNAPMRLVAQIHNDLQDLIFALEYNEQGVHQHIPEHVQDWLGKLYDKTAQLHELLKGEKV